MKDGLAGIVVFLLTLVLAVSAGRQLSQSDRLSAEHGIETSLLDTVHRLETSAAELAALSEYGLVLSRLPLEERRLLAGRQLDANSTAEVLELHLRPGEAAEVYRSRAASDDSGRDSPPITLVPTRLGAGEIALRGPEQERSGKLVVAVWSAADDGTLAAAGIRWDRLHAKAGLGELASLGYAFRLTRSDPGGTTTLARSSPLPFSAVTSRSVELAGTTWTLALAPQGAIRDRGLLAGLLGALLSLMLGLITFALTRKPAALEREHAEQLHFAAEEREQLMLRVAEYQREDEQLKNEFFHDPATGLPTRAYLLTRLDSALESVRRDPSRSLSLMLIELGEFRSLVDTLGSRGADIMLREVAQRVGDCLGAEDLAARMSPDELAVMVTGRRGEGAALTVGRSIQNTLARPFEIAGSTLYARVNFGLAHSDQGLERAGELLSNTDLALRRARAGAAGELAEYAAAMRQQAVSEQLLESDLRAALDSGQLEPYFQPIIDLEMGSLVGFEALVRWHHPQEGFISPGRFMPLAEDSGLVVNIDRLMLQRVCEQTREWLEAGVAPDLYVSVNLSGRHLLEPDITSHIATVLEDTGLPPQHLRLEITESALIGNFASALEHTQRLQAMGLKLLLDDFGTGYSSLSYLHRFNFDVMKVDGSFVRAMTTDGIHRDIVRTVLTLSRNLGMSTVAEGIEHEDQRAALRELGCPYGQGYLFDHPLPAAEATARLFS